MQVDKVTVLEVTINGSHAGSQALAQHLHSHLVSCCNLFHIEHSVKFELFGLRN